MREILTQFCENIANGMSATASYQATHPNAGHDTCKVNACKWMARQDVQDKINEMKLKKAFRMNWNYEDSEKTLVWAIEYCQQKGDVGNLIRAVQELNKMGGFQAPEKRIEIKAEVESKTIEDVLKNVGYIKANEAGRLSENSEA